MLKLGRKRKPGEDLANDISIKQEKPSYAIPRQARDLLRRAKVELAGVEPASKHGSHMLSTCLFLLHFRDMSAAEQPNLPLFPVCFAIGSEQPSD